MLTSISFPSFPPAAPQFFSSMRQTFGEYSSRILESGKQLLERSTPLSGRAQVMIALSFVALTAAALAFALLIPRFMNKSDTDHKAPELSASKCDQKNEFEQKFLDSEQKIKTLQSDYNSLKAAYEKVREIAKGEGKYNSKMAQIMAHFNSSSL